MEWENTQWFLPTTMILRSGLNISAASFPTSIENSDVWGLSTRIHAANGCFLVLKFLFSRLFWRHLLPSGGQLDTYTAFVVLIRLDKKLYTREEVARLATAVANPLSCCKFEWGALCSIIQVYNTIDRQWSLDTGLPLLCDTFMRVWTVGRWQYYQVADLCSLVISCLCIISTFCNLKQWPGLDCGRGHPHRDQHLVRRGVKTLFLVPHFILLYVSVWWWD